LTFLRPMAMTDASKRKAPEPDAATPATATEAAKPAEGASATTAAAGSEAKVAVAVKEAVEPESKRLKPTPPDAAAVRKQVEYYLSDDNLKYDKFFHDKISEDKEGWLAMSLVLSCNKMKAMRATKEDVLGALKDSKIEIKDAGTHIRRPGAAALPELQSRPQHQKKNQAHAHDGGVVCIFKEIPEEQSWMQIKEKLREKLPDKVNLWYVSEVTDKNTCIVCSAPFEDDMKFFEEIKLEIGGSTLKCQVAQGGVLQDALKVIPKHIKDRRDKESRRRQKERNRPIIVGSQKFLSVAALRGRVKEILNARSDGEALKPDGSDFKLIKALLGFHPKGKEKSEGMTGIKVAKSSQGDSLCFWMIKGDGKEEDFSAQKCLAAIEANPPYVEAETKPKKDAAPAAKAEAKPAEAKPAEAKAEAAPAAKAEAKPAEEVKTETKPAEEAKAETKPAEEAKAEAKPAEEAKTETKPAEEAKAEAKPAEAA